MKESRLFSFRLVKETKLYSFLFLSVLATVFFSLNRVLISVFLGHMVDTAILHDTERTVKVFASLGGGIITLAALSWLNTYLSGLYAQKSLFVIRAKTIGSIEEYSYKSIAVHSTGELISRINSDIEFIRDFLKETVPDTVFKACLGIFAALLGFYTNWKMTIFIIIIPVTANILNYVLSKPLQKLQKEMQDILGDAGDITQDAISGNIEVKTFDLTAVFYERFARVIDLSVKKKYEIAKLDVTLQTILDSASVGAQVGAILLGIYFVIKGELTLGDLVIFQQIQTVIGTVFGIDFLGFRKAAAAQERIFEIWDEEKENLTGEIKKGDEKASLITFRDLNFSYPGNGGLGENNIKEVLSGFSLDIKRNESVAIVGHSGSGKSTVAKLICGLLKPEQGTLMYKGRPYENWDLTILRDGISLVDQNTYLFPTTIFENIACGIYGKSKEIYTDKVLAHAVEQACKEAALEEFVISQEEGYGTMVGEWGVRLSGGQRQRIAVARAFVRDSELLILDEPTSNLDAEAEQEVQRAIDKLMEGRTTIIITHKLDSIKNVDRIIMLNEGRIVEEGTHQSLMNKKGYYYNMYKRQGEESEVLCITN